MQLPHILQKVMQRVIMTMNSAEAYDWSMMEGTSLLQHIGQELRIAVAHPPCITAETGDRI